MRALLERDLNAPLVVDAKVETGGLSGLPVKPLALSVVSQFYKATNGEVPIIGCGGIASGKDAIDFAKAGASLVQLYTSLGYQGPGLIVRMKEEMADILKKEGKTWKDVIGENHK